MSEWWTYRLGDLLMFSPRIYYRLIGLYNEAVWPAQVLALAAGPALLLLVWRRRYGWAAALLGAGWLWVAWGFLYQRYATINWAAGYFAAAFAAQGVGLAILSERHARARPGHPRREAALAAEASYRPDRVDARDKPGHDGDKIIGLTLITLAILYPLVAPLAGRPWSQAEVIFLMPDPTVLATLGLAVAARRRLLLVIPLLWCAVEGATLWVMKSPEAWLLPAAGVLALILSFRRGR